ncbi:hypothetical protein MP228_006512 [Amoeboaphelidium protococcarum]|nr:hypothetical protein MP228_006512 [Amoeboaphelidium protococcarum]
MGQKRRYTIPKPFASSGSNTSDRRLRQKKQKQDQDVYEEQQESQNLNAFDSDAHEGMDLGDNEQQRFSGSDDEEISEDDAFNEDDEMRYGSFFDKQKGVNKGKSLAHGDSDSDESQSEDDPSDFEDDADAVPLGEAFDSDSDHEAGKDYNTQMKRDITAVKSQQRVNLRIQRYDGGESDQDLAISDGSSDDEQADLQSALTFAMDDLQKQQFKSSKAASREDRLLKNKELTEAYDESEYHVGISLRDAQQKVSLQSLLTGQVVKSSDADKSLQQAQSLAVPLPALHQEKVEREVAYKQAKKEISKWIPIVQQNRRADQLVFPLPQSQGGNDVTVGTSTRALVASFDSSQSTSAQNNDFESSILSVLNKAKVGNTDQILKKEQEEEKQLPMNVKGLTMEDVKKNREELLKMRALLFYSEIKSKRAAKVKSKKFKRLLKKEKKREEAKLSALSAGNNDDLDVGSLSQDPSNLEIDADEHERLRAEERVTLRHRLSQRKNFEYKGEQDLDRLKMMAMIEKHQQLTRKIAGKDTDDEDAEESQNVNSEPTDLIADVQKSIDDIKSDVGVKGVYAMKFMKDAMIADRKQYLESIKRDDFEQVEAQDDTPISGRMQFGPKQSQNQKQIPVDSDREYEDLQNQDYFIDEDQVVSELAAKDGKNGTSSTRRPVSNRAASQQSDAPSSTAELPDVEPEITFTSQKDLISMAFADDNVIDKEFSKEKKAFASEEAPQEVDNRLPGWGHWEGAGVSKKQKQKALQNSKRFTTKSGGVEKENRKDRGMKRVIITEKKDKKFASKYLVDTIPFPYKSREQYEASLRIPLGKEWNTVSVHNKLIQPRVSVKPGKIIQPLRYTKQPADGDQ